ncbi:MAG TPA: ABC transporter ATP-binding protein [Steroidobacteraceae bacterium]
MPDTPLLSVSNLSVHLADRERPRTIVEQVSFDLGAECVALVGESGSGKSLTARALLGLLRPPLVAQATHLQLGEVDLQRCSATQWNRLRGTRLSLMLQDPRHSLNPVLNIERQLELALGVHQRLPAGQRRERIAAMLEAVGLTQLRQVLAAYPHQISGGMGQRVVLAMMLLNDPQVLIADEPTSALDAALREQVMELIRHHVQTRRMGLLLISHDLQLVAHYADRALVMHRGRIVDQVRAADLPHSLHPYTHALWAGRPSGRTYGTVLPVLP